MLTRAPRHLLSFLLFIELLAVWLLVARVWCSAAHSFLLILGLGVAEACLGLGILRTRQGGGGGLGLVSGGPVFGHVGLWSPKRGLPRLGGLAPASNWYNGLVGPPPCC